MTVTAERVRRAEVLAALSLAIDLGLGQPMDHMLRSAMIATSLAGRLGLSAERTTVAYYTTLLTWIGCHADSHEITEWFGDDITFRADTYDVDWAGLPFAWLLATHVGRDRPALARAGRAVTLFAGLRGHLGALMTSHCLSAGALAERAGLGDAIAHALTFTFERFDGSGLPAGASGDEIPLEMRIAHVADVAEVHLRRSGVAGANRMVAARRGTQFDPVVADAFVAASEPIAAELAVEDAWAAAVECAPDRERTVGGAGLDRLLAAVGDFADLKFPFMVGHSRAVAVLAADAARRYGLPPAQVDVVRRAGLLHDIGRMGVPNSIWEKRGRLSDPEWERVRLYPYLTGRILHRVAGLGEVAAVAGAHRERMDGSGYPRGLAGAALTPAQRLLAAADAYRSMREDRPYRRALPAAVAADELRAQARTSRLDAPAVEAVLEAAGERVRRRRTWPAGLTEREVEVLRRVARGDSNGAIAAELRIAEKTVRNHVEHIYLKINVNNRAGASLYATRHGIAGGGFDEPMPET